MATDGWLTCDMKENTWHKNEMAHQMRRVKTVTKSHKARFHRSSKIFRKANMNLDFNNWGNGETSYEIVSTNPTHSTHYRADESQSPEAIESPERLE
jgi:hypothetical protein